MVVLYVAERWVLQGLGLQDWYSGRSHGRILIGVSVTTGIYDCACHFLRFDTKYIMLLLKMFSAMSCVPQTDWHSKGSMIKQVDFKRFFECTVYSNFHNCSEFG